MPWQTTDSLGMPQSLLCTPVQTHTLLFIQSYITRKANLIHSFPSLALHNSLCYFLSLLIVLLTCFIPSPSLFVILWHYFLTSLFSNIWSYTEEQCFGSMVVFSLVEILRLFLTSFVFPSFLHCHLPCLSTHHWFNFEKEIHMIAWSPIFSSWILPETASTNIWKTML